MKKRPSSTQGIDVREQKRRPALNAFQLVQRIWVLLFVGISAWLLYRYRQPLVEALPALHLISFRHIAGIAVLQGILWLLQAGIWRTTLKLIAGRTVSWRHAFVHLALLSIGKYVPGKIWGMAARGGQMIEFGMNVRSIVAVSLYEQLLIVVSGLFLALSVLSIILEGMFALTALALFIAGAALLPPGLAFGANMLRRLWPGGRAESVDTSLNARPVARAPLYLLTGLHAVAWLIQGAVLLLLLEILSPGAARNPEAAAAVIGANSIAAILGFVAVFAPAGAGVRDASLGYLLEPWFPVEIAVLLVVVTRAWLTLADLILGVLGGLLSIRRVGSGN